METVPSFLAHYRKLAAAVAGLAVLFFQRRTGLSLAGLEPALVEMLISAGTAFAVWLLPNRPSPDRDDLPGR